MSGDAAQFHYRPTAVDLVVAVREFLAEDVLAATEGRLRYNTRIAVRLLETVARELTTGPDAASRHGHRLQALGYADDAALAAAVREGRHDHDLIGLLEALEPAVRDRLEVANPVYLQTPLDPP